MMDHLAVAKRVNFPYKYVKIVWKLGEFQATYIPPSYNFGHGPGKDKETIGKPDFRISHHKSKSGKFEGTQFL